MASNSQVSGGPRFGDLHYAGNAACSPGLFCGEFIARIQAWIRIDSANKARMRPFLGIAEIIALPRNQLVTYRLSRLPVFAKPLVVF